MKIVRFTHSSYGEMETTVESWIEYETFDATDEKGESYPVNKDDCSNPHVNEF